MIRMTIRISIAAGTLPLKHKQPNAPLNARQMLSDGQNRDEGERTYEIPGSVTAERKYLVLIAEKRVNGDELTIAHSCGLMKWKREGKRKKKKENKQKQKHSI
jgi:hypothetical protein